MDRKKAAVALFTDLARGEIAGLDDHLTPDCEIRFSGSPEPLSLDAAKAVVPMTLNAFSEHEFTFDDVMVDGDKVAMRCTNRGRHTGDWMGIPPTGKPIVFEEMIVVHFKGDRIHRVWIVHDYFTLVQQMGMTLTPAAG